MLRLSMTTWALEQLFKTWKRKEELGEFIDFDCGFTQCMNRGDLTVTSPEIIMTPSVVLTHLEDAGYYYPEDLEDAYEEWLVEQADVDG